MATINNAINANAISPLITTGGGSGVSAPTAHGVLLAEGASPFTSLVMGAGTVLIGTTASDPVATTLTAGTNISITSVSGSITISANPNGLWLDETGPSVTMAPNTGYTSDDGATLVTFTLPTTAVIGDYVEIQGKGAGLFKIAQAASQQINFGNIPSTSGTGGSVSSTLQYDAIKLRALTAGATSTWSVVSCQGNFSVV